MANYNPPESGFDSYLLNILPDDIALAAGAFSASMKQIRNVKYVSYEKLGQVVKHTETTKGLNLVNGTDNKPTNTQMTLDAQKNAALGSGPYGSYTCSDLLGAMSGLPYPYEKLLEYISKLQTLKLCNIYHELYLAVSWKQATAAVSVESFDFGTEEAPDIRYRASGITLTDGGGGYYRGTALPPNITLSNGGSGTTTVDTNVDNCDYGTFGQVVSTTLTNQGAWQSSPTITATVECPPIEILAVLSNGERSTAGVNTPSGTVGWTSPMQEVMMQYIDQANEEIQVIATNNPRDVATLNFNTNDISAYQLTQEQRSRFIGIPAVPIFNNQTMNNGGAKMERLKPYPGTIYQFVDNIPTWGLNTLPHMYVQTLEAISNIGTVGGQSVIAMMREARNKERLFKLGIEQNNTIPDADLNVLQLQTTGIAPMASQFPEYSNPILGDGDTLPSPMLPMEGFVDTDTGLFILTSTNPGNLPLGDNAIGLTGGTGVSRLAVDNGQGMPGSLAGSPYQNLLEPHLNTSYTAPIVTPSSYGINDAIDQVTLCNCECWLEY